VTIDGVGLTTGFIGLLNYTTRDYTLQFTVRHTHTHTHTNLLSPGVFSLVVTSQRRSFLSSRVPQGVREQKRLNTTDLDHQEIWPVTVNQLRQNQNG
jgi:hypothetical protein